MTALRHGRKLRCAMVGGGRDAFIGGVHRNAMALDGQIELVAGALSSSPEKALLSGRDLGLAPERNHRCWQDLIEHELKLAPEQRVDFVTIVTPNDVHFDVARACVEAGLHVVCDKPLVHNSQQAATLVQAVRRRGTVFAVTYNYSGYPMVRQAREMVRSGAIGSVRKVIVEYHQGWLATHLEGSGHKQATWRTDPARGLAGAIADIGSHAEQLLSTVTGLQVESLCADLASFVPGRQLDDDASVLLRLQGGARGVLLASQAAAGNQNDIRLRVFGSQGSLDWRQEEPNELVFSPLDSPRQVLTRGSPWLAPAAQRACRLPAGHPEAFLEAFANIYLGVAADIASRWDGGGAADSADFDYPHIEDGARGVRFIERTLVSATSAQKWTPIGDVSA